MKATFHKHNIAIPRVGLRDAIYIYRFEIMILVHVKAKSLLCYWAVRDLGIGMVQIARRLNL